MNASEIISVLKSEIADFDRKTGVQEGGTVVRVGDGIATVYGMQHAMYGELVEFETGMSVELFRTWKRKTVGCRSAGLRLWNCRRYHRSCVPKSQCRCRRWL